MVANTWIAAAPGNWSDDANWSLGHSPIAGEDPTFDGTSVNNCAANDDTPCGVLTIAAGYTGTITQSSDMHITGYSQAGGTFTGGRDSGKIVYCNGNWVGGGITPYKTHLKMLKDNSTMNEGSFGYYYPLQISAKNVVSGGGNFIAKLIIDSGCSLKITTYSAGRLYVLYGYNINYGVENHGEILGPGRLYINFNTLDRTDLNVGNVTNCYINNAQTNNRLLTNLSGNIVNLFVGSASTGYMTLNLNGHSLTATTITVGTRGILSNSAATDSVISCNNFDSSAGTFTPDHTVLVMEGASTLKLAAGGAVENLLSKGVTTLASDVTVSDVCAHVNPITKGAFALTLTKPENEYTGLRRPIIIPVKKLDIGPVGLADGWLRDLGAVV